tara:strand:+ start:199 stop:1854 length:1656 start_codon:yes stop_codon:yes gene_type:complete
MRFENYRIRLYYKLNKLQKGKWGKPDNFIYLFGSEIPSFSNMDSYSSQKIYEGDTVIYKNPGKPNHPNNGLKATVVTVHKPQKMEQKIEAWEKNRRGSYPLEKKKYDLVFILDEDDKEDRRMNLVEGNRRGVLKRKMKFVDGSKIKRIPEKVLMVSVKKSELQGITEAQKKKLLEKRTKILLKRVFHRGLEFEPKYVDKTSKNYESMAMRNREEGFFVDKSKEKIIQRGDIVTTVDPLDRCSMKTYQKPTKKYKLKNFNIVSMDVTDAVQSKEKGFYLDELEREFYIQEGLRSDDSLLNAARAYLVDLRRNVKIRDSSRYARAVMEKKRILRNTNSDKHRIKNWGMFLSKEMIQKTFRQDLKSSDEKREQAWLRKIAESDIFDFMVENDNKFLLRPLIEQLFIVRQIIGHDKEPGLLSTYITDAADMSIFENDEQRNKLRSLLKKYGSKSITSGNIPRIIVKLKLYIQSDDELGAKLGIGPRCEQSMDELKTAIGRMFGFARKRKKKTKKKKRNKGTRTIMEKKYMGGRKSHKKKTKKRRKKRRRRITRRR